MTASPAPLTRAQRNRLVGVLGRLGSNHDGERAAAGLLACRLLDAAGLSWDAVILGSDPARPAATIFRPSPQQSCPSWRSQAGYCVQHLAPLTPWQTDFLRNLAALRVPPTPRQLETLSSLYTRALERAAQRRSGAA